MVFVLLLMALMASKRAQSRSDARGSISYCLSASCDKPSSDVRRLSTRLSRVVLDHERPCE